MSTDNTLAKQVSQKNQLPAENILSNVEAAERLLAKLAENKNYPIALYVLGSDFYLVIKGNAQGGAWASVQPVPYEKGVEELIKKALDLLTPEGSTFEPKFISLSNDITSLLVDTWKLDSKNFGNLTIYGRW